MQPLSVSSLLLVSRSFNFWMRSKSHQTQVWNTRKLKGRMSSAEASISVNLTAMNLNSKEKTIEFGNQAFSRKSTWEIIRALTILKACSFNCFVDNSLSIMKWCRRMLGSRGLRVLFKPTLYDQFVGGETHQEIQRCVQKLSETGIRPMLAATMEEDVGDTEGNDDIYDSNCARILECIKIASAEKNPSPMMQLKMTGLLAANLVVSLSELFSKSHNQLDLVRDMTKEMLCDQDFTSNNLKNVLDSKQLTQLRKALLRLKKIGQEATSCGVKVLVDAEYTYMNPGLSLLTLSMANEYNKTLPVIWNTYQCYLKDARKKVTEELDMVTQMNVCFGAKLVRGAYVTQERARSQKLGVEDPICSDYKATSDNYNEILSFLLEQIKERGSPKCMFIVASHNEESVILAVKKIEELCLDKTNGGVSFGQLYGMCDQVTYPLASLGYAVYKSIPYGTVDEVLPYLSRRATENKAVLEGCKKERYLLWEELKNRILLKRGPQRET